jgi:hypothetical protein
MKTRRALRFTLSFITVLLTSLNAAPAGKIFGTVTDPTGAVVAGATIAAHNQATGIDQTATTDQAGNFLFTSLSVGVYTIMASHPGFRSYRQESVTLDVDQALNLEISLQLGAASETVSVSSAPPQVDTRSGTISEVVTEKQISELPLNGRNVQQLVSLQAGVQITGRAYFYNADVPQSVSFFSVSGTPGNDTNYILDGGDHNDTWTNIAMPTPNPDALQEFSVQTSNFTAEYGSKAGGVVNMVVKSGANSFHGSLFEFLRNYDLNSRAFFALSKDGLKRNQYGGTFGGRIIRDKTFFFGSYQGTNLRTVPSGLTAFVPTAAQRMGNLAGTAVAIDPLTKQPFPNNQIPQSRLDPVMAQFLNQLVPLPNGPNGLLTYGQASPRDTKEWITRIDHNLSTKDRLFGTYFDQRDRGPNSGVPNNVLSLNFGINFLTKKVTAGETHVFSPSLVNDFRFTYGDTLTTGESAAPVANNFTWQGIGMQLPRLDNQPEMLYFGSPFFSFYTGSEANLDRRAMAFADTVTKTTGRHELKFGVDIIRQNFHDIGDYESSGYFTFSQNVTGNPYADLVMGFMSSFTQINPDKIFGNRNLAMFWAQDTVRVSRRLTLTLGARYEPYTNWRSTTGMQVMLAPGQQSKEYPNMPPGILTLGDAGVPKNGIDNQWNRLGPRVGFAFDPAGDGKTSIRGGYGIFYDIFAATSLDQFGGAPPFTTSVTINQPYSFANPYQGVVNPFPAPIPAPKTQPQPLPVATIWAFPKDLPPPMVHQWNMTLERQLPQNFVVRAAYVGSHGMDLQRNLIINAAIYVPGTDAQGNPLSTTANVNSRRPFPGYQTINYSRADGTSNLNSLLVTLERRLAHGLAVKANYTFQKSLDDAPQTAGNAHQNQLRNPLGKPNVYGPSDFDRTHNFVADFVWQIPTPFQQNRVAKQVLGGWELTGIASLESGQPFTVASAGDPSRSAGGPVFADYIGGCNATQRPAGVEARLAWFNTKCFTNAAIGTFGNLGRNGLRGPGFSNLDAGVYRNFRIRESMNLQFRSELFNVLNHPNFAQPNSSLGNLAAFGTITSTAGGLYGLGASSDPRVIQFALKFLF